MCNGIIYRLKHILFRESGMVKKKDKNKKTQLLNITWIVRQVAMHVVLWKCLGSGHIEQYL